MSDLKDTLDALYSRLILRDITGKVLPGLIAISAFIAVGVTNPTAIASTVLSMPVLAWILLYAVGWLAGLSVQALGDSLGIIRTFPKESGLDDASFHDSLRQFREGAKDHDLQQNERFIVIREACGNGYVAIGLALLVLGTYSVWHHVFIDQDFCAWLTTVAPAHGMMVAGTILAVVTLGRFHFVHVRKQWCYMQSVTQPNPALNPTGDNAVARGRS